MFGEGKKRNYCEYIDCSRPLHRRNTREILDFHSWESLNKLFFAVHFVNEAIRMRITKTSWYGFQFKCNTRTYGVTYTKWSDLLYFFSFIRCLPEGFSAHSLKFQFLFYLIPIWISKCKFGYFVGGTKFNTFGPLRAHQLVLFLYLSI